MPVLTKVTATCPQCGVVKAQIDSTREHAVAVVTEAMRAHLHEEHLEPCADPYCRVCRDQDGEVRIP